MVAGRQGELAADGDLRLDEAVKGRRDRAIARGLQWHDAKGGAPALDLVEHGGDRLGWPELLGARA